MTQKEAEAYLKRAREEGSKPGLARVSALLDCLEHPERAFQIIQIAGTNGKGSVGAFLSSILAEAGDKVGRFFSPAVFHPWEIIEIKECPKKGKTIPPDGVTRAIERIVPFLPQLPGFPTIFEWEFVIALLYFQEEGCHTVILEAGMGGALDATNGVEHSELAVFTSISRDHMQYLGNTEEAIARAKGGIIRQGEKVVSCSQSPEIKRVLEEMAKEKKATLLFPQEEAGEVRFQTGEEKGEELGTLFSFQGIPYEIHLGGVFQISNAILALLAARTFRPDLDDEACKMGLRNTRWPGRFQVIGRDPLVITDGAHNEGAAKALKESLLLYFPHRTIHFVTGMFRDKEVATVFSILKGMAVSAEVFRPEHERGMPVEELMKLGVKLGCPVTPQDTPEDAFFSGLGKTSPGEILVIFGSLSIQAQALDFFKRKAGEHI